MRMNKSWLCLRGWGGQGEGGSISSAWTHVALRRRDVECRGIRWCLSFWRVWDGFSSEPATVTETEQSRPLNDLSIEDIVLLFNELNYFFVQLFWLISGDKRGWQWQNWPSGWEGLSHRSSHLPRSEKKNFLRLRKLFDPCKENGREIHFMLYL